MNNNGNNNLYKDRRQVQCFNCRNYEHFAKKCTQEEFSRMPRKPWRFNLANFLSRVVAPKCILNPSF
jgi:hypothetical protein